MSTLDAGYAPLSYHCGSVWPHDTAIALARPGRRPAPTRPRPMRLIERPAARAAEAFDYRLPELYGGDAADRGQPGRCPYPRRAGRRPGRPPPRWPCSRRCGLAVDVPRGEVRVRPLPGLGAIEVRGCG